MSLVQFALSKDAVGFQKELHEKIEVAVNTMLEETKVEIAQSLFGEGENGIVSSAGGVKTKAEGGKVGKDRLPDTTDIKSSEGNPPPGGTKQAHVETKPGTSLTHNPHMPGPTSEEFSEEAEEVIEGILDKLRKADPFGTSKGFKKYQKKATETAHKQDQTVKNALKTRMSEESEPKSREENKGKRALRLAMKKKYDKKKAE